MKRILAAIATMAMMLSASSCSNAETDGNGMSEAMTAAGDAQTRMESIIGESGVYNPGTYSGSGMGHNGSLVVEVTVTGHEITAIRLKEHTETEGLYENAEEQVTAAILEEQATEVDAVAGATFTSNGIMEAVSDALEVASAETAAKAIQPGIYTTRVSGYNGEMEVSVTLNKQGIEKITADHRETDGIGAEAIAFLTERIISDQTLDIETISGATVTSSAYLTAVKDALGVAGVSSRRLKGPVSDASTGRFYQNMMDTGDPISDPISDQELAGASAD